MSQIVGAPTTTINTWFRQVDGEGILMARFKLGSLGSDTPSLSGILWKLGVLGVVDAVATTMIMVLLGQNRIWIALLSIAVLLLVNWIYLRKGGLPAKYLAPGVIFLFNLPGLRSAL